ncbi:universal stress protein [Paraglaciecola sp.]|uniref:universal stress protein n=1 Tax=Paraglaciecola sp. TaxID=1920173 RepID=UPI0030F41655
MQTYKKILVALEIHSEHDKVLAKAISLAALPSDLSLVFVSLPLVNFQPYGMAYDADLFTDICQQSKQKLQSIAALYGIPENQLYTPVGSPADEIHLIAEQINADLIVMGTHGKSGLKLLLGSTANGVLHGVKCDVLAVKV